MNDYNAIGRLTKDPEINLTKKKKTKVARFTLAVPRQYKVDGQPEADFIRTIAYGKTAENCEKYIGKGSRVYVKGEIRTRTYTTDDGKDNYVTELFARSIEFLDYSHKNKNNDINVPDAYDNEEIPDGLSEDDDPIPF